MGGDTNVTESIDILGGEYVLLQEYRSAEALIAQVSHVHRRGAAKLFTPVARVMAFAHPCADMIYSHWSVHLFVRSDIRYESATSTTTALSPLERQVGPDTPFIEQLRALRDSDLPAVNPNLPRAIGETLITIGQCSEPAVVHIYTAKEGAFIEFGKVFHDDE